MKILAALILAAGVVMAQQQPDVAAYVKLIESGQPEPVRAELPSLLERYPNNPGVLYLQALLTADGTEAVRLYQGIVDNHPKSEWADDALYRVYQFYYALGLYRTAELKMAQLQKEYPRSPYAGKTAAATQNLPEEQKPAVGTPAAPAGTGDTPFALQVGAYSLRENAVKQKLFFEDQGEKVEVINRVRDNRSLFLVLVGRYRTADDARIAAEQIRTRHNIEARVVTR